MPIQVVDLLEISYIACLQK